MPASANTTASSSRASISSPVSGSAPSPPSAAAGSSLWPRRGAEPRREVRVRPELGLEGVGDGVLDLAVQLQPPGADARHLAREPELEEELGLDTHRTHVHPGAD